MRIEALQLAELIARHAGSLQLWIRSCCPSPEDVVQEALCKLAIQDPAPENPVAWLYRVCRNLAQKQRIADMRRRKREQSRAPAEATVPAGEDSLDQAEVLAAVETLADEFREVLVARLWGQLSLEEVARLCGISTTTAFRRYNAAIQILRDQLSPQYEKRP